MENRAKSYAYFMEGISSYVFFSEGTTRQIDQQLLGHKFSLVCAMGNRQMDPSGAAVQGGRHKAARNLSRASAARVHTRRLAKASRLMGWIDLGFG
jgi:hypothetical protein